MNKLVNTAQRRKLRVQKRRLKSTANLQQFIKSRLPTGGTSLDDLPGVIKALRALGSMGIPAAKRAKLRANLVESLASVMKDMKIKPKDLGVKDLDLLAELFVRMLERMRYHEYGVNELRRKKVGLRGVFAGELFELLVLNMESIQKELKSCAEGQFEGLNSAMRSQKARLIDANGVNIAVSGKWAGIERVTDIIIYRNNQKLKFTDFAYATFLDPPKNGPRLVSFLVETEVKLPRAASEFSEQMGVKQARFAGADRVEFIVEGQKKPVSFKPEEIIFDSGNINRVALTTTKSSNETWRLRSTRKGGYDEIYWRIGLVVEVEDLRRLVNILFRH